MDQPIMCFRRKLAINLDPPFFFGAKKSHCHFIICRCPAAGDQDRRVTDAVYVQSSNALYAWQTLHVYTSVSLFWQNL